MRLRLGLLLVVALGVAPTASHAQSPKRGWFLSVRAGLGLARARCDSPCVPPRKHFGPEITYALGHGVGDRATIALTFFGFGAPAGKSSREGWMISNGGFEVSARPTPANETSASAILAIGQYERARLTKASVATWGVRVAHDDPARQGFGAFVAAHGTLIGMAHAASVEDAGRHIGAEGISAGAMYTWR